MCVLIRLVIQLLLTFGPQQTVQRNAVPGDDGSVPDICVTNIARLAGSLPSTTRVRCPPVRRSYRHLPTFLGCIRGRPREEQAYNETIRRAATGVARQIRAAS